MQRTYDVPDLCTLCVRSVCQYWLTKGDMPNTIALTFKKAGKYLRRILFDELRYTTKAINSDPFLKKLHSTNCFFQLADMDITGCKLTHLDCDFLRALLRESHFTNVNISGNSIASMGAAMISSSLSSMRNLHSLDLSDCVIGPTGIQALGDGMKLSTIRKLSLKNNCLVGVEETGRGSFNSSGVLHFFDCLQRSPSLQLEELNIANNGLFGLIWNVQSKCYAGEPSADIAHGLASFLMQNISLKLLDISQNNVGKARSGGHGTLIMVCKLLARALQANTTLESLNMERCSITNVGLRHLSECWAENETLIDLNLSNCAVTSGGVFDMCSYNPPLRRLNLSNNAVDDDGFRSIVDLRSLEWLSLKRNDITRIGLELLLDANFLRENEKLQVMNLCLNREIGIRGLLTLTAALDQDRSLKSLLIADTIGAAAPRTSIGDVRLPSKQQNRIMERLVHGLKYNRKEGKRCSRCETLMTIDHIHPLIAVVTVALHHPALETLDITCLNINLELRRQISALVESHVHSKLIIPSYDPETDIDLKVLV
eukprot:TRINITY_DN19802_c0_g1_i1.p1 TRINITY_DN19802_c0_g1~~TRINITY_DN19802_c0_g1_i1.p1  ORF type:complete len:542 (-),score=112.24 TRINITY_DN19802_c0_g1_i1:101-1726(-)